MLVCRWRYCSQLFNARNLHNNIHVICVSQHTCLSSYRWFEIFLIYVTGFVKELRKMHVMHIIVAAICLPNWKWISWPNIWYVSFLALAAAQILIKPFDFHHYWSGIKFSQWEKSISWSKSSNFVHSIHFYVRISNGNHKPMFILIRKHKKWRKKGSQIGSYYKLHLDNPRIKMNSEHGLVPVQSG